MQHREREREREMQELACRVVTFKKDVYKGRGKRQSLGAERRVWSGLTHVHVRSFVRSQYKEGRKNGRTD